MPVSYGNPPPDVPGCQKLYILDFSYPRETLRTLSERIPHVTVIDHHHTAQVDLEGLGVPAHPIDVERALPGLFIRFDMNESGASLAWRHFYRPDIPGTTWTPEIIQYVKDRDLWLFQKPRAKEIHSWLRSHPLDFQQWNWLNHCLTDDAEYHRCVAEGEAILRSTDKLVAEMAHHALWLEVGGYRVPCCNATVYFSEVGDYLCEKYPDAPFAAYYLDRSDGKRQWGLRSRGGFDVSEVARMYGGGGHKAAAGFTTERPPLL